jgi:hypothetical protein
VLQPQLVNQYLFKHALFVGLIQERSEDVSVNVYLVIALNLWVLENLGLHAGCGCQETTEPNQDRRTPAAAAVISPCQSVRKSQKRYKSKTHWRAILQVLENLEIACRLRLPYNSAYSGSDEPGCCSSTGAMSKRRQRRLRRAQVTGVVLEVMALMALNKVAHQVSVCF